MSDILHELCEKGILLFPERVVVLYETAQKCSFGAYSALEALPLSTKVIHTEEIP